MFLEAGSDREVWTKHFIVVLLLCGASMALADDSTASEADKIQYLIHSLESLSDATFIRNGQEYDSRAAADHLRLKLAAGCASGKSAASFILDCASASSLSHEPYRIRFSNGSETSTGDFLRKRLTDFR